MIRRVLIREWSIGTVHTNIVEDETSGKYWEMVIECVDYVIDCERERGEIELATFLLNVENELGRAIADSSVELSKESSGVGVPILHSAVPRHLAGEMLVDIVPSVVSEFDPMCAIVETPNALSAPSLMV